jgi:flagellar biosynthesis protein FliP
MTLGAFAGMLMALGVVLALLGLAARGLRRLALPAAGGSRVRLEVVDRIAVGPRQGLAVVRIGERLMVVSVGDGGVRPVRELDAAERAALVGPARRDALPADGGLRSRATLQGADFVTALRGALRRTAGSALVLLPLAGAALGLAGALPAAALAQEPAAAQAGVVAGVGAGAGGAAGAPVLPRVELQVGGGGAGDPLRLSGTVGTVVVLGLLTLLPTLILLMTGFTRILIVLHLLRQALGTQSAPPAHLMAGLAMILTAFVMLPTLREANRTAIEPWLQGQMEEGEMLRTAAVPFREFMLATARESDVATFLELSGTPAPETVDDIPLVVLVSAFTTSELRTAFQIGFMLFLPFVVIDLVVASTLMSMGMFMLPPTMIALPCKLLLFVLVDGWALVVQSLVQSFGR